MKKIFLFLLFNLVSFHVLAQNDSISFPKETQFILVRHAEKLDKSKDPDLSKEGKQRAQKLSELLADVTIDKLFSTPYLRTQNTLLTISERTHLNIESYNPNDINFASTLLKENNGKTVIISGHSNTTPKLANQLIGKELYEQLNENEYGKIWIITFSGTNFINCIVLNY